MRIAYARESRPSALKIADENDEIELVESSYEECDINWGRRIANATLNPNIENAVNKRKMRQLFQEHGVPAPKLYSEEEICSLYVSGETPMVVGRPDYHARKRGFWLIEDINQLNRALRGTWRKKPATHFMEYISKARAPREYRAHVFQGKSIRISEKLFSEGREYTTIAPTHSVNHVREAAKKAIEAVGLDFGAVDILANDSECWVLEVNSAPGLGGTMPEVYANVFKTWLESQ